MNNNNPEKSQIRKLLFNRLIYKYIRFLASLGMTNYLADQGEGKSGELSEIAGFSSLFISSPFFPSPS